MNSQQKVKHFSINLKGNLVDLSTPVIMGILNVTPDSFYDGGKYDRDADALRRQAGKLLQEGATILDIGGYSTRPGAAPVEASVETRRVTSAIHTVLREFPDALISVDTFRAGVAEEAVGAGAAMINDVSGGNLDARMFETVAKLQVPYVLMHMRGNPQSMTSLTQYDDLLLDILDYFQERLTKLRASRVADVIIDPGFGFAKTIQQNFELLQHLEAFHVLNAPMLVGVSRKAMTYKSLKISPEEALNGTTVLNTVSLLEGASILRVHDVKEALQAVRLINFIHR